MSHQIVECPGCLTNLRVKESSTTIRLQCPRCGEQLEVDPVAPEPPQRPSRPAPAAAPVRPPAKPAASAPPSPRNEARSSQTPPRSRTPEVPQRPAARPTRKQTRPAPQPQEETWDNPWDDTSATGDDAYDSGGDPYAQQPAPPSRRKPQGMSGLKLGLLVGAGGGLVGLIVLVVMTFLQDDAQPTGLGVAAGNGTTGNGSAVSPDQSGAGATGAASQNPGPVDNGASGNANVAPSPFAGGPIPPSVAAISADTRKLRYQWKPGAEYHYQFSIEEGTSDQMTRTQGSCVYAVRGDAAQLTDAVESTGTGFVVAADGVIATCAHVVEGAKHIEIQLGGQSFPAQVLAVDGRTDVALVRIQTSGLTPLPLMDSDGVQLAEAVRAIGYPLSDVLGTDVKVTTGTVSGITTDKDRGKRIQVDAPINPGNSGGPVVNGAGQVVGIASAKMSGSSVTAVGFAAPINALRSLGSTIGLQLPTTARGTDLPGPEVARRVTPSVAYIKVKGSSSGRQVQLTFSTDFTSHEQQSPRGGFPGRPSFPTHAHDQGSLTVNSLGEVLEFQGTEQLPAVLGPAGLFFLEPLDAYSESAWQIENESTLQRINRDDGPLGGRFGGRMRGFGPPGFGPGGPFGQQPDQVVEEIPATERVGYQVGQTLNNKLSIAKTYEFTATRSNGQPYMTVRGQGTVVFDLTQGMPASLEYQANVEQADDSGTIRMPVKVAYTLRNSDDVKREREQMLAKIEADRKQQEAERTTPNPARVDELLAAVRAAEGGGGAADPLQKLGDLAVVDDKRDDVLRIARNHMKNSNGFVKKSAAEAFCNWATKENLPDLQAILKDEDGLMHDAKRRAVRTMVRFGDEKLYPDLIQGMTDFVIRDQIRDALSEAGSAVEPAILETWDKVTDSSVRRELIDVLKKVGTAKCETFLEKQATGPDGSLRHNAQQALDAVRSRL